MPLKHAAVVFTILVSTIRRFHESGTALAPRNFLPNLFNHEIQFNQSNNAEN